MKIIDEIQYRIIYKRLKNCFVRYYRYDTRIYLETRQGRTIMIRVINIDSSKKFHGPLKNEITIIKLAKKLVVDPTLTKLVSKDGIVIEILAENHYDQ